MIYFDIDGVLRDLHKLTFGYVPKSWYEKTPENISIFDKIRNDISILEKSPKTKYFDIINKYAYKHKEINLISNQPKDWQRSTLNWLNKSGLYNFKVKFTKNSDEKLKQLKYGDILVDDSPQFLNYEKNCINCLSV